MRLYVLGNPKHDPKDSDSPPDTLHNATEAYRHAGFKATTRAAAATGGSRLLRRDDVQDRIREVEAEAAAIAETRLFRWGRLLADAQDTLIRAMAGEEVSTQAIRAAREVIQRAEGPLGFRFRNPKTGEETAGIPIYVLGVDDLDDDELEDDEE